MKILQTLASVTLILLVSTVTALAQGLGAPPSAKSSVGSDHSGFCLNAGLLAGKMHSELFSGGYVDAAIGNSRFDLDIALEEIPSVNGEASLQTDLPSPYLNRVSLMYGREIYAASDSAGTLGFSILAGPAYTFGVARGNYLYTINNDNLGLTVTNYYQPISVSRLGLTFGADIEELIGKLSRGLAFGLRTSVTIDKTESYGLFGITVGYVFN